MSVSRWRHRTSPTTQQRRSGHEESLHALDVRARKAQNRVTCGVWDYARVGSCQRGVTARGYRKDGLGALRSNAVPLRRSGVARAGTLPRAAPRMAKADLKPLSNPAAEPPP